MYTLKACSTKLATCDHHLLLIHRSLIQEGSCTNSPAYGGGGGTSFYEKFDNCNAVIKRVTIRHGRVVDAIQITYQLSNGNEVQGGYFGGYGGDQDIFSIEVDSGERIIAILGRSGGVVDQLTFITNQGRSYGPYGWNGGQRFRVESCVVRGIYGRSGGLLDNIGFICTPP